MLMIITFFVFDNRKSVAKPHRKINIPNYHLMAPAQKES